METSCKFDDQKLVNTPWLLTDFCDWSFIKKYGRMTRYKKGSIIQAYDNMDSIFYIDMGRVRTSAFSDEGEEKIILVVDRGNLFNLVVLASNIPSNLSYTAVTDSIIYKISTDVFIDLLKNDNTKAMNAIMDLSRVVKILSSHVEDMTFMRAPSRVAKCLYMLCNEHGTPIKNGIKINIKFTHYEMAIYAGTCRVTVSHILEDMEKNKIISKENGYCIVNDLEKLKSCIVYI
jgi:CRP/FNR family transcriptional regulator, cyclic AMP receptor protein